MTALGHMRQVFLPGWEQGAFPLQTSSASLEEEWRLAYVALTRCRTLAAITYARRREWRLPGADRSRHGRSCGADARCCIDHIKV